MVAIELEFRSNSLTYGLRNTTLIILFKVRATSEPRCGVAKKYKE
jgi:hypothetical protein